MVNYEITDELILEIKDHFVDYHAKILKDQKNDELRLRVRTLEQAEEVLKLIDFVKNFYKDFEKQHPTFIPVFENDFEMTQFLNDEKKIIRKCFVEPNLFRKNDYFNLSVEGEFQEGLMPSYYDYFSKWKEEIFEQHKKTQEFLRQTSKINIRTNKVTCGCSDCVSLFRTRVRESILESVTEKYNSLEEELYDDILNSTIDKISHKITRYIRFVDKELKSCRYSLRKSSYNKLHTDIKKFNERKLAYSSENQLTKTYGEKLKAFLISESPHIQPDFYDEKDFEKFFDRLKIKIWKPGFVVKKEFLKHTESLMALKRKDISSTILRNYLGQFWHYSDARKLNRKVIYHMGPTNSGKTYHALQALSKAEKGSYLAPLRLLASEVYDKLTDMKVNTTLLTGEEVIENPGATHFSSTIEMAKLQQDFDCIVIDEIQMIGDYQRGWAWTRALVHMKAKEIHLCGDPSALELVQKILKLTGDELEIKNYTRMTDLKVEPNSTKLESLVKGDALIVFSRRNALKHKVELEKLGHRVSIVYGMLNPDVRREQARRFDEGETDIIVSTDAISMGMNLPVRRIVFTAFSKFINSREHPLTDSEIKQIAGRAGRFQRFPTGFVTYLEREVNTGGTEKLRDALNCELEMREMAMVGPDLDLFLNVNNALGENSLRTLQFSEFLRLFYTIEFSKPFYCVRLDEMIEIAETVEEINEQTNSLDHSEIFGFSCAPVNLGNIDHVQYFHSIVSRYAAGQPIYNEMIDTTSNNIDYLETAIKCLELYQWLARHFSNKHFTFDDIELHQNKAEAVEKLNKLLSDKTIKYYNPYQHNRSKRRFDKKKGDRKGETKRSRSRNSRGRRPPKQDGKPKRRRRR